MLPCDFNYKFIIIILILLLLFYLLSSNNSKFITNATNIIDDNSIVIDKKLFNKMVDIVTDYSLKGNTINEKYILIYMSTFHLFDMNYDYKKIKALDEKMINYPYIANEIQYPTGRIHLNLQKTIITHITYQISRSERELTGNRETDRQIIYVYLYRLFATLDIIKF